MLHYVTSYMDSVRSRRALPDVQPGFMQELIPSRAPETPDKWEDVFKDIERVIMPGVTHWQSPNFFAYFPTAQSYPSMLADMLCNAIGCIGFTWASCPSCTELEVVMMDWLGQLLHLPDSFLFCKPGKGGGVIQGTASEATLMCLLSARTLFFKKEREKNPDVTMGQLVDRLVAYCSDQAHSSVERAGLIGAVRMRKLETDEKGSLRGPTLKAAILEDKAKGLLPFFVCATSGTTTSCAFDNLKELGPVCQEHGVWMHVDAAYAGSAFICPEFRPLIDGVEHWQIPLGRRFRSLKIWFVLRLYGQRKLQEAIRKDVRLAHEFETMGENELSERLLKLLNADGRIHLVPSKMKGNFFLRLAICGPDTQSSDVRRAWDVIRELTDVVLKSDAKS
nr:hypothetical protein BaRGS_033846 [Batillaria attramentaria]